MKYEREPQPESWWVDRYCPSLGRTKSKTSGASVPDKCYGQFCVYWRITKIDEDGNKHGICTKA